MPVAVQRLVYLFSFELIFSVLVTSYGFSKSITYLRIDRTAIQRYLLLSPADSKARLRTLHALFLRAGCDSKKLSAQPIPGQALPNLVCILPSSQDEDKADTIVIGAGMGYHQQDADESWHDTVMLPLLVESMNSVVHRSNVVFIALSGSEGAQSGLAWYLNHLSPQERKRIRAVLVLKSIGADQAAYIPGNYAPKSFAQCIEAAAETLNLPPPEAETEEGILLLEIDHWRIPGIILESQPQAPMLQVEIPGAPKLKGFERSLQLQRYENAYNFLCVYLLYLDDSFSPRHHRGLLSVLAKAPSSQKENEPADAEITPSATVAEAPPITTGLPELTVPRVAPAADPTVTVSEITDVVPVEPSETAPGVLPNESPMSDKQSAEHNPTFHSTSSLVLVDVVAQDPTTALPLNQLRREDFIVSDDGRQVPIETFDSGAHFETRPIALWMVAICNEKNRGATGSGSFAGKEKRFRPALDVLDKRDRVGVAHWCDDGQAQLDLLPTEDRDEAISTLAKVLRPIKFVPPPPGQLRRGELALQMLFRMVIDDAHRRNPEPLPVMVLLHGDYTGMPVEEVNRLLDDFLENAGIAFGIKDAGLPDRGTGLLANGEQGSIFHYIVQGTGGEYFSVPPGLYSATLRNILSRLHARYELGFKPLALDGRRHTLTVEFAGSAHEQYKSARLLYRPEYIPTAVPGPALPETVDPVRSK